MVIIDKTNYFMLIRKGKMAISIADSYYLKALDLYPYELDKVTEALNYAITYDDDHAGAHCLLGILKMYQLGRYEEAEFHYEKALSADINHIDTYYAYSDFLIQISDYTRAKKLIKHAYKIKGINVPRLRHNEGLIAEISGDLSTAKDHMKYAYENSYRKNERQFLKEELSRVKSKLKAKHKSSKS